MLMFDKTTQRHRGEEERGTADQMLYQDTFYDRKKCSQRIRKKYSLETLWSKNDF